MSALEDPDRIKAIANKIKKLRIAAGFTSYEQFAYEYDIQPKQYWRLESGHNFMITSLLRIVNIHNITLEEFFKGID